MKPVLETLEIEPEQPATASVIWMHGLGADARDFYSVPSQLGLPVDLSVRYIFPDAPKIPVTINMRMIMRAWYDVTGMDRRDQDEKRIRQSAAWIDELVKRENERGVPTNHVVLAGFSQGGALALFAGVRYPEALAGVMCLSGYLLLDETLVKEASAANRKTSIFQAHGTDDPVVPYALGRGSCDLLKTEGFRVDWNEYPMGHSVCMEELQDVGRWLGEVLAP
jgi:phospholipase/carboxylesterase